MRHFLRMPFMPSCVAASTLLVFHSAMATSVQADPHPWPAPNNTTTVLLLGEGQNRRALTLAELEALPHYQVKLSLIWGEHGTFQGIKLGDLLKRYGLANSKTLRLSATDRYTIEIDAAEWRQRDPLIATRFEMRELTIRQKGPLRLLWPDEAASLETSRGMQWIWSLVSIKPLTAK